MSLRQLHDGSRFAILAYVRSNGVCQIAEYLDQLVQRDQKRVAALLKRVAEHGPPRNPEKSAAVAGQDFWEFKAYQQRIFWCYTSDRRIVLLYGFTKKENRTRRKDIDAGRRIYQEAQQELDS